MISYSKYFEVIQEDLNSSIKQSKTILANNGIQNVDEVVSRLVDIYNTVRVSPEFRRYNFDMNIPVLAYLYIPNSDMPIDRNIHVLKLEYEDYLNIPVLTTRNMFQSEMANLKKEITSRKLFKPSEEKSALIKNFYVKIVEAIHANKQVESKPIKKNSNESDENTVYEDSEIIVYRADSKQKCITYGQGTNLCIASKGGGNYYWSYRMGNMGNYGMTTYYMFRKNENLPFAVIDAEGDEDGPSGTYGYTLINEKGKQYDDQYGISKEYLIKKVPEAKQPLVQDVFQFIPYGEREKRFFDISERMDNRELYLLHPDLKTMEDYEMFIELYDSDGDYDDNDYYYDNPQYIDFKSWDTLSEKIGENNVSYLVKKYSGLDNIVDIETQKKIYVT